MADLAVKNNTPEPLQYHQGHRRFERFEVVGFGKKGDSVVLASTRLFDLEIEGSIHPFKWEQDGPNAVTITLVENWHGYMLIPVIGIPDAR